MASRSCPLSVPPGERTGVRVVYRHHAASGIMIYVVLWIMGRHTHTRHRGSFGASDPHTLRRVPLGLRLAARGARLHPATHLRPDSPHSLTGPTQSITIVLPSYGLPKTTMRCNLARAAVDCGRAQNSTSSASTGHPFTSRQALPASHCEFRPAHPAYCAPTCVGRCEWVCLIPH